MYSAPGYNAPGSCKVFLVDDRCADGYKSGSSHWCSQEMSPDQCVQNPAACKLKPSTNMFGYPAHFDLNNWNYQIMNILKWDNAEVTFEQVSCSLQEDPVIDWQKNCICPQKSFQSIVTSSFSTTTAKATTTTTSLLRGATTTAASSTGMCATCSAAAPCKSPYFCSGGKCLPIVNNQPDASACSASSTTTTRAPTSLASSTTAIPATTSE